jgi:hypothetical protein
MMIYSPAALGMPCQFFQKGVLPHGDGFLHW